MAVVVLLGASSSLLADYPGVVTGQNPLEYYRLDTLTGENSDTLVQNGVSINQGGPAPTLNPAGGFLGFDAGNTWANFDGTDSNVLTDVQPGWTTNAGTISFWAKPSSTGGDGTQTFLFATESASGGTFNGGTNQEIGLFKRSNGSTGWFMDGGGFDLPAGTMSEDEWLHLAYSWERNTGAGDGEMRLYIDGAEEAALTNGTWDLFTINAARVGKEWSNTRTFSGSIDEFAIFDRALSGEEIQAQFAAGTTAAPVPEPASIAIWSLLGLCLAGYGYRRHRKS